MDGVAGRAYADPVESELDLVDASPRRAAKSAAAFRTISEVATELDVPPHVLRFWESKFPQIKPLKRGGGRRYYRPEDVELLRRIKELLYTNGYTIKGVQKLLRGGKATDPDDIAAVPGPGLPTPPTPAAPPASVTASLLAPESVLPATSEAAPAPIAAPRPAAPVVPMRTEPAWRDHVRGAITDLEAIRDSLLRNT
jgi:DNA-binding transcriptional MerR regulator